MTKTLSNVRSPQRPLPVALLVYGAPLALYCGLIFVLSSMTQPPTPDLGFEWSDKFVHAGAYGVMMILALWACRAFMPNSTAMTSLGIALLFCSLYGVSDEFHQYFVPGRDCDVFDWVADTVGALLSGLIFLKLLVRRS